MKKFQKEKKKELEKHCVARLIKNVEEYANAIQHSFSYFNHQASQFGKGGRADLQFSIGPIFTFYIEAKSPTGTIKDSQQYWADEQNSKHPLMPSFFVFGVSGAESFTEQFLLPIQPDPFITVALWTRQCNKHRGATFK